MTTMVSDTDASGALRAVYDAGNPAELRATNVERVVRQAQGARALLAPDGRAARHGLDRTVGLRQVDVHPHPEPDARGHTRARRSPAGWSSTVPTSTAAS